MLNARKRVEELLKRTTNQQQMVELPVEAASVTEDNAYDYIYEVPNGGNQNPALREDGDDPANRQSGIRR